MQDSFLMSISKTSTCVYFVYVYISVISINQFSPHVVCRPGLKIHVKFLSAIPSLYQICQVLIALSIFKGPKFSN